MTLVCHHPEVASNPGKYFDTDPGWRENGVVITPSTGIYLQEDTSEDLTRTTLNINITVDHFMNQSFKYSCVLAVAKNGIPTGEVETSENVTVDPVGEWVLHVCMHLVLIVHIILYINTYICTYSTTQVVCLSLTQALDYAHSHTLACLHHH